MLVLAIYIFSLFVLGIGNAIVTYHIIRYRDPDDRSLVVLIFYYSIVIIVLVATALSMDWNIFS